MSILRSIFGGSKSTPDPTDELAKQIEQSMYAGGWAGPSMQAQQQMVSINQQVLLNGMQVVEVSDPAMVPASALPIGNPGNIAGAVGHVWYDTSSGIVYTNNVAAGASIAITPEEREQLKQMEEDRKTATKKMKIDIFKKLPATLRQQVVDSLIWQDAVQKINAAEADKSEEQKALEAKDVFSRYMGSSHWTSFGSLSQGRYGGVSIGGAGGSGLVDYPWYQGAGMIMPKDLTADELMRAHNEATLEEELLDSTESK